jgi:DNA polymerase III sliding clamp (beta) subunit (PCNA family)
VTKLKFEVATLAGAIKKASRIAPTKAGKALDSSAGIVLEISPQYPNQITLKATNLEVFYLEVVPALEVQVDGFDGAVPPPEVEIIPPVIWRLSSSLLAQVIASLPQGSGQSMSMEQIGSQVQIKQNRAVCKLNMINTDGYPRWNAIPPENLYSVEKLGALIAAVEWAASKKDQPPITGVHFNGLAVAATDKYRLAMMPCFIGDMPPVTIPSGVLGAVIRPEADVQIGMVGNTVLLMPDEATQIKTVIYDADFPNVMVYSEYTPPAMFEVSKALILDIIQRATIMTQNDRDTPHVTLIVGAGEFAAMGLDAEQGLLGDVIMLNGNQANHKRVQFKFTPQNIIDGISNAPNDKVVIYYNPDDPAKAWKIDGGSGYISIGVPRGETKEKS